MYQGDPNLNVRVGSRYIRLGLYAEGRELIEEAMAKSGLRTPLNRVSLALSYLGEGALKEALEQLELAKGAENYMISALEAVCLAADGQAVEARSAWRNVLLMRPDYQNYAYHDLLARGVGIELREIISTSLEKMGVDINTSTQ